MPPGDAVSAADGNRGSNRLHLSLGLSSNPRTQPILDGLVTVDDIDITVTVMHPSEMFWRQLKFGEFDVSEMSMSSLLMATAHGDDRFVGIPVFTTRAFYHTAILVRTDRGIETPADLKGKQVGVPEYQQTAALWARGALQHEFGVAPQDMEFWMERTEEVSHGGSTGFRPPPGVTVNRIPSEKNIGTMMLSGELDATLRYIRHGNLVDRSTADLGASPLVRPLFPDAHAEGRRFYGKTGLFPINHGMVMRREVAEKHPWAIEKIFEAFQRANALVERQRIDHTAYHLAAGLLPAGAKQAIETQLVSHGIAANRTVLETVARYSHEQGLTPRVIGLEELYAENMLGT